MQIIYPEIIKKQARADINWLS
jgi:hypothetical protein